MGKVFVVRVTQIYDGEELRNDVRVFSTMEKAKEYAKAFIEDEKKEIKADLESGWIENDNLEKWGSWEAYADGYYCTNHTEVEITEEEVY